jgi:hypothetical protein
MLTPDPYPKIKNAICKVIAEYVEPMGFQQLKNSTYYFRDRRDVRDIFFFQKMRSNAITIAYGVLAVPTDDNWIPGIPNGQWLARQEFYRCKNIDHVRDSISRAMADFTTEAIPWFEQFQSVGDLPN